MIALNQRMNNPKRPPKKRRRFDFRKAFSFFSRRKKESAERHNDRFSTKLGRLFDGIIGVVFPGIAASNAKKRAEQAELSAKRELYQEVLSGRFNSIARNDTNRESRWTDALLSPDAGLREDLYSDQVRARELYRNNTIGHSAVEGRVTHEVGTGITPQSQITEFDGVVDKESAKMLRRLVERNFRLWSEGGVDQSREFSFYAFQRQVAREFATMGEAFVLVGIAPVIDSPINLALQLISAERVETPPDQEGDDSCRLGVQYGKTFTKEIDENGNVRWIPRTVASKSVVTGYWVRTEHPGHDRMTEYEHVFYPRFDETGQPRMIHVFDPIHPEQSRGIPWLAAAANRMKDVDDFFEAELIAKQIEACFGVHFQTEQMQDEHSMAEAAGNGERNGEGFMEEDIYPGMVHRGPEQVTTIDPQRPGASFAPFIEAALRSIAAALNYPYEFLAKNFFRTTYSSGKLAVNDGEKGFAMRASVLIDQLCRPIWKAVIYQLVRFTNRLPIPFDAYLANKDIYEDQVWRSKPFGAIDEEKLVKSRKEALESEQTTYSAVATQDGGDFFDDEDVREQEGKRKVERRIEIEKHEKELREKYGLIEEPEPEGDDEPAGKDKKPEPAGASK